MSGSSQMSGTFGPDTGIAGTVNTEPLKVPPEFFKDFALTHDILPLEGGAGNTGMALHHISRDGQDILKIVEKRTRNRAEIDFYQNTYHILEASNVNVPRLYKIQKIHQGEYSVFTEAVHGVLKEPVLDNAAWKALGNYLSRLALLDLPGLQQNTTAQTIELDTLALLEPICEEDKHLKAINIVRLHLPAIKQRLSELPYVSSHLDLSWKNMAAADDQALGAPYIFDWGTVSLCFAGADLHFFADEILASKNREHKSAFFRSYAKALSLKDTSGAGVSADDLLLAALTFGLFKRLQWAGNIDPVARPSASRWIKRSLQRFLVFLARQSQKMVDQKILG